MNAPDSSSAAETGNSNDWIASSCAVHPDAPRSEETGANWGSNLNSSFSNEIESVDDDSSETEIGIAIADEANSPEPIASSAAKESATGQESASGKEKWRPGYLSDEDVYKAWCEWKKWRSVFRVAEPFSPDDKNRPFEWKDDLEKETRRKYYNYLINKICSQGNRIARCWMGNSFSLFSHGPSSRHAFMFDPEDEDYEAEEENAGKGGSSKKGRKKKSRDYEPYQIDFRKPFISDFDEFLNGNIDPSRLKNEEDKKKYAQKKVSRLDYVFDKVADGRKGKPLETIFVMILSRYGYIKDIVRHHLQREYHAIERIQQSPYSWLPSDLSLGRKDVIPFFASLCELDDPLWHEFFGILKSCGPAPKQDKVRELLRKAPAYKEKNLDFLRFYDNLSHLSEAMWNEFIKKLEDNNGVPDRKFFEGAFPIREKRKRVLYFPCSLSVPLKSSSDPDDEASPRTLEDILPSRDDRTFFSEEMALGVYQAFFNPRPPYLKIDESRRRKEKILFFAKSYGVLPSDDRLLSILGCEKSQANELWNSLFAKPNISQKLLHSFLNVLVNSCCETAPAWKWKSIWKKLLADSPDTSLKDQIQSFLEHFRDITGDKKTAADTLDRWKKLFDGPAGTSEEERKKHKAEFVAQLQDNLHFGKKQSEKIWDHFFTKQPAGSEEKCIRDFIEKLVDRIGCGKQAAMELWRSLLVERPRISQKKRIRLFLDLQRERLSRDTAEALNLWQGLYDEKYKGTFLSSEYAERVRRFRGLLLWNLLYYNNPSELKEWRSLVSESPALSWNNCMPVRLGRHPGISSDRMDDQVLEMLEDSFTKEFPGIPREKRMLVFSGQQPDKHRCIKSFEDWKQLFADQPGLSGKELMGVFLDRLQSVFDWVKPDALARWKSFFSDQSGRSAKRHKQTILEQLSEAAAEKAGRNDSEVKAEERFAKRIWEHFFMEGTGSLPEKCVEKFVGKLLDAFCCDDLRMKSSEMARWRRRRHYWKEWKEAFAEHSVGSPLPCSASSGCLTAPPEKEIKEIEIMRGFLEKQPETIKYKDPEALAHWQKLFSDQSGRSLEEHEQAFVELYQKAGKKTEAEARAQAKENAESVWNYFFKEEASNPSKQCMEYIRMFIGRMLDDLGCKDKKMKAQALGMWSSLLSEPPGISQEKKLNLSKEQNKHRRKFLKRLQDEMSFDEEQFEELWDYFFVEKPLIPSEQCVNAFIGKLLDNLGCGDRTDCALRLWNSLLKKYPRGDHSGDPDDGRGGQAIRGNDEFQRTHGPHMTRKHKMQILLDLLPNILDDGMARTWIVRQESPDPQSVDSRLVPSKFFVQLQDTLGFSESEAKRIWKNVFTRQDLLRELLGSLGTPTAKFVLKRMLQFILAEFQEKAESGSEEDANIYHFLLDLTHQDCGKRRKSVMEDGSAYSYNDKKKDADQKMADGGEAVREKLVDPCPFSSQCDGGRICGQVSVGAVETAPDNYGVTLSVYAEQQGDWER